MKIEYHGIYQILYYAYESYPWLEKRFLPSTYFDDRMPDIASLATKIRDIIDKELSNKDDKVQFRADSKFMLLSNLHQMVVIPLLMNRPAYSKSSRFAEELEEDLRTDIRRIIKGCVSTSMSEGPESNEVTAHTVIRTVENLWKDLRITALDIWG